MPLRLEWPVVFRPRAGEVLSSWILRIAGVYDMDGPTLAIDHLGWPTDSLREIDLTPPERTVEELAQVARLTKRAVERHTVRSFNPVWLDGWVTLCPPAWNATDGSQSQQPGVLFNVCPACLHEDLAGGGQYIRMKWLCAATTICDKHLIPLIECFDSIHLRVRCRSGPRQARFVSQDSRFVLDSPFRDRLNSGMLVMLSAFEQNLSRALESRFCSGASPFFEGRADVQFVSVVRDLTWALMQTVEINGARLIHYFETDPFPVPAGWRNQREIETLSRADVKLRRSLLAVIAC